ncbi:c-type cytochrome [Aquirufa sp.]|jgi:mono/diheme cytochrome c family protein|uniref:c-type cytochrome n=1 Tax=Aquirufa sp. TaxID=2676249 RepID=UPI0037C19836
MKRILVLSIVASLWACLEDKNIEIVPQGNKVDTVLTVIPSTNSICDTVSISFDKSVWSIMNKQCVSCHNASNPSAGVDLSSYDKIQTYVKNGKLYGSLTHAVGYKPMPSATLKLNNCDITMIRKWIRGSSPAGAILVDINPTNPINPVVDVPVIKPPIAVNCSPDTVYFKQKILPLIVSNCAMSGCHDAISKQDGVILTDYTNIMREVKISNPAGSDLYKSLIETREDRMPPAGPLSTENINNVLTWIKQGAKNNGCDASATNCITSNVSFKTVIQPILATN